MKDPTFSMAMTFASKEEFKEAVKIYAFKHGKELRFVKNDKERFVVCCRHAFCPWKIRLRKVTNSLSWRILSMKDKHDGCTWSNTNRLATSTTVAKRWCREIKDHDGWKMIQFKNKVKSSDGYEVSRMQAYRAMTKAKKLIQGDEEDNFSKLWSYVAEIRKTNPLSTCCVKLSDFTESNGQKRFLRMYMCWEGCRTCFQYCRPLIGVDGCHLKASTRGQMLVAIGIGANDNIFPLAYAIVEGETKDSWCWFFELLKRDMGINEHNEHEFTAISDKQKGLIPACEAVLPRVEHRFCVRHLHSNMKVAGFQGKAIKDSLWSCARAYTVNTFTSALRKLRDLDMNAYDWLANKHPSQWSRSHFSCIPHSDMLVNNICECFNSVILEARDQPIISCLETIRKLLMKRLFESRERATHWTSVICPKILHKIEIIEKQAAGYITTQCDFNLFEVSCLYGDQQEVDLEKRSCSCRVWDLTGIPCKHAVSVIWLKHGKGPVFDYVHPCYRTNTYLKIYASSINPMAGLEEWPLSDTDPPLPPQYTARPGRPKKLRKKSACELSKDGEKVARIHIKLHCTKCRKPGHNARTCPLNLPKQKKQNQGNR